MLVTQHLRELEEWGQQLEATSRGDKWVAVPGLSPLKDISACACPHHHMHTHTVQVNELHSECKPFSYTNALGPFSAHLVSQGSNSTQSKL